MQANQNPSHSLYIVYTYRENVFLYAIYFIFKHLYSYFMKKLGGGGGGEIMLYLWSDHPNLSLQECSIWSVGYWTFNIWPDLFFPIENLYLVLKPKTSAYLSVDISYSAYT